MKHIKNFIEINEEFTLEDSEDISISLAGWWIPCSELLPENRQLVIIYSPKSQMGKKNICQFHKGISKKEREEMGGSERARTVEFGDEDGNNMKPYAFKVYKGPGQYFGQEVTHWMPLPADPNS